MYVTHPSALERLEKLRRAARKKYFGKREINGVSFAYASDLLQTVRKSFGPPKQPRRLANAIRRTFPDCHPKQRRLIARRFTEAYGVPEDEAIKAVLAGYTSPSAAMKARVIRRRAYRSFEGEREP
jgi:hypothetical protein